jgi:hypothetical protein
MLVTARRTSWIAVGVILLTVPAWSTRSGNPARIATGDDICRLTADTVAALRAEPLEGRPPSSG